jgi:LemA protein
MGQAMVLGALAAIGLLGAIFLAGIYNCFVRLKNQCNNAFAQIEVQLTRRYDLIPNLVECVKGYMCHERECLSQVTEARNKAATGLRLATQQPEDVAALQKWMGAEGTLGLALGRLNAVIESYPELKANAAVVDLTEQLTNTENRIAYARQTYNDWATGFNDCREAFPACLLARTFGFQQNRGLIQFADSEQIAKAPSVVLV